MYFDGAVNRKGMGIGAVLESPSGKQLPASVKLQFNVPMAEYEAGLNMARIRKRWRFIVFHYFESVKSTASGRPKTIS
jgi:hypothetical protein